MEDTELFLNIVTRASEIDGSAGNTEANNEDCRGDGTGEDGGDIIAIELLSSVDE